MKYFLAVFSAVCLLALMSCGTSDPAAVRTFSLKANGISIQGTLKPEAKATAKEYKAAVSAVIKKK